MNRYIKENTIKNLKREGGRSYALVFMMTTTYLILGLLLVVIYTSQSLATYFIQKPEVIGFFKDETSEEQILQVKKDLESMNYVAEVTYISKEEAMKSFLDDNRDKKEIIEAVSVNVFPAHLNVRSQSLDKMPEIANYFRSSELIEDTKTSENIVGTLKNIIVSLQIFGFSLLGIFTLSTSFIMLLATGLTIYSRKDEIIAMKLVGADDWFVRGPYVLQSLVYSLISVVLASLILLPVLLIYYNNLMNSVLGGQSVPSLTIGIIGMGVAIKLIFGLVLAFISSYYATRRYIDR